ncbi:MAG: HNH endonuclease signature motif containing protein [Pseudomonadota bacterium]
MSKITPEMIEINYEEACNAYRSNGQYSVKEAISATVKKSGMSAGSASDGVRNLFQMLAGESYHRTFSKEATRIFFGNILRDFGPKGLSNAIKATELHLDYYDGLKTGGKSPGRRAIVIEFKTFISDELKILDIDFEEQVERAADDAEDVRLLRLSQASGLAEKEMRLTTYIKRNPDVVAQVLATANGICGYCRKEAPFKRKKNGEPYLEVHHKIPLAEGGLDNLENAIALCPNCHREAHFGLDWKKFRK